MTRTRKMIGLAIFIMAVVLFAGCGVKDKFNDNRGRGDAPVGERNDNAKDVINFPDRFPNVASSCDGHGHRVFVTTHDKDDSPPAIVADPSCGG